MKFYIKPTEEHPNEQKEYTLIREGVLKLFTGESYDKTPEDERLSRDLSEEYEIVEFQIKDEYKTKAFKVILEGSSTYKQKPLDPNIITKPCIYQNKECYQKLRFPKQNQKNANIGIIKAYKKDINTHTFLTEKMQYIEFILIAVCVTQSLIRKLVLARLRSTLIMKQQVLH